jgi:hypothetical protein
MMWVVSMVLPEFLYPIIDTIGGSGTGHILLDKWVSAKRWKYTPLFTFLIFNPKKIGIS